MTVYFDHNATSPLDERVREAMLPYLSCANPSSQHAPGRRARAAVDEARERVAGLVGSQPAQVIFTSGGTEANNLALLGAAAGLERGAVAVSTVEHPSVLAPAQALERAGWELHHLAVDDCGRVLAQDAVRLLGSGRVRLCSVMAANNETGVLQDVAAIAAQAREAGILLHTDAVQLAGKLAVDFGALGAHLMSLSAHKLGGPKGVGALIVDKRVDLHPLLWGGGQERGLRSGTENVAGIVGFGAAALAATEDGRSAESLRGLRDYLEERLAGIGGVEVLAREAERLPNTVMFTVLGIDGETTALHLDAAGFAVSSGSACHSGSTDPSHVLLAMGIERERAYTSVRVSLGRGNDRAQIDAFAAALRRLSDSLAGGGQLALGA